MFKKDLKNNSKQNSDFTVDLAWIESLLLVNW